MWLSLISTECATFYRLGFKSKARMSLESDYYYGHADADQHLRHGHVFLRMSQCYNVTDFHVIYCTVIPFSPHQYVVTMSVELTFNVMIIRH